MTKQSNIKRAVDNTVDKLSQQGVHVVKKTKTGFVVFDIIRNKPSSVALPTWETAHTVCVALNTNRQINGRKLEQLITQYEKWKSDCVFYSHAMENATNRDTATCLLFRLEASEGKLEQINEHLRRL